MVDEAQFKWGTEQGQRGQLILLTADMEGG